MFLCLMQELNYHTLWAYNQSLAALMLQDYAEYFKLGYGLLHTEAAEYSPATALYSPSHGIFDVRI